MGHGAAFDLVHNSSDVTSVTVADFDLTKVAIERADQVTRRVEGRFSSAEAGHRDADDVGAGQIEQIHRVDGDEQCVRRIASAGYTDDAMAGVGGQRQNPTSE